MRDVIFLLVYIVMFALVFRAPAIAALAYIMTDLLRPQYVAYGFLASLPLSFITASVAVVAFFFIKDRPVKITSGSLMLILWCAWMTLTTIGAEFQDSAWMKWDWVIKSTAFSVLLPYYFNTRVQIESVILIILVSMMGFVIPFGVKTLVSGGGYGISLGLFGGNTGFAEGSTLAMGSVSIIPLFLWAGKYSQLFSDLPFKSFLSKIFSLLSFATAVGTFARTGLLAIGTLLFLWFFQTKKKIFYVFCVIVVSFFVYQTMGENWKVRMSTLGNVESEGSAMGRVAVWLWTIDYVLKNPLGGGFDVFRLNDFTFGEGRTNTFHVSGKAFHSIYFEVLGEQGFPGFALFIAMIVWCFHTLYNIKLQAKKHINFQWLEELATALIVAILIYLAGGAFVGVAYQSYFWFLYSLVIALRHYADKHFFAVASTKKDPYF